MKDQQAPLRKHLAYLLGGGGAHVDFDTAVAKFPEALRGTMPSGSPHTAWRLIEHMRIAQRDILEFSRNPKYVSPEFPDGYWPRSDAPPAANSWAQSVKAFRRDLKEMLALVADPATDLFARIAHGNGQTLLREALLVADHNAYHLGELIMVRRLLGAWPEE
jgi:DinB superfamily